jgi:hypothetical protein
VVPFWLLATREALSPSRVATAALCTRRAIDEYRPIAMPRRARLSTIEDVEAEIDLRAPPDLPPAPS